MSLVTTENRLEAKNATNQHLKTVAIVGHPNTGKSTIFNRLTGLRQRVGNYPGVTVDRKVGKMTLGHEPVHVVDLPGIYSLNAQSLDEQIAADVICGKLEGEERPNVLICVLNACSMRRSLFLAMQIFEFSIPTVLAVNFMDEAEKQNFVPDLAKLSERLKIPVLPIVGRSGKGIAELKAAIEDLLENPRIPLAMAWPTCVEEGIESLQKHARDKRS